MLKQMCWLPTLGGDGTKILHLRTNPHEAWRPYNTFPEYAVPDYPIPGGSKGWATFQKLRLAGWILESSGFAGSAGLNRLAKLYKANVDS